jgi:hypothetical protein
MPSSLILHLHSFLSYPSSDTYIKYMTFQLLSPNRYSYLAPNPTLRTQIQTVLSGGGKGSTSQAFSMALGGVRTQDDDVVIAMAEALKIPRYRACSGLMQHLVGISHQVMPPLLL